MRGPEEKENHIFTFFILVTQTALAIPYIYCFNASMIALNLKAEVMWFSNILFTNTQVDQYFLCHALYIVLYLKSFVVYIIVLNCNASLQNEEGLAKVLNCNFLMFVLCCFNDYE